MDRRSSLGQTWMTVLLIASLWFTSRSNKTSDPSMQKLLCARAVPRLLWRICVNSVEIAALAAGFSTRGNHCARWAYWKMAERVGLYPTQFVVGTRWDAFFRYRNLLHPKDLF